MAILLFTIPTAPPSASSLSPSFAVTFHPVSRLCNHRFYRPSASYAGCRIPARFVPKERGALIAKASSDVEDVGLVPPSSESDEENVPIENLPLESKLQLKLEQKMKMKLAKKIRLRRKKLVRKRRLRKKGRWPPSKLKKNKNV